MNLKYIANRAAKLAADNSTAIFTAMGVTGVVTTAYLTARASFQAAELLLDERLSGRDGEDALDIREKVELTWKLYLPAAGTGILTVTAIIAAHRVGTRRAAALAAAYTLSDKAFMEYRDKIVEKMGDKREQEARDELAQDRVTKEPPREVILVEGNSVLCLDAYTGRYFLTNVESLRQAVNEINHQINNSYYASLSDFYEKIGLDATSVSEEVGWNADKLLELQYSTVLTKDKRPCLVITFSVAPIRGYHRIS